MDMGSKYHLDGTEEFGYIPMNTVKRITSLQNFMISSARAMNWRMK